MKRNHSRYIDIPLDARDQWNSSLVFRDVTDPLKDVRAIPDNVILESNGFVYRQYKTNVRDFISREKMEQAYFAEVEQTLRAKMTGLIGYISLTRE